MTQHYKSGLPFEVSGKITKLNTDLSTMLAFYRQTPAMAKALKGPVKNARLIGEMFEDGINGNFVGATRAQLDQHFKGGMDMAPFEKERLRFRQSGLLEKLQTRMLASHPKRKRRMSEHDGEWDYSRRWEVTPFSNTTRVANPGKMVNIECDFSISCMASAEEINRFGAMAWALSDIIEASGIVTTITLRFSGGAWDRDSRDYNFSVCVKKAGQYMAPSLLAASFQSAFLRRVMFASIVAMGEEQGVSCSTGLGYPKPQSKRPIEFKDGALWITANVHKATTEEMEGELIKAIA